MNEEELTEAVMRLISQYQSMASRDYGVSRALAQEVIVLVAQNAWAASRVKKPE